MRRIRTGTVSLEVIEAGTGGRPLMVVHGFTGAKEDLAEHLDELAAGGWHAVAPDLRGHGSSDHPSGQGAYSPEIFVADLLGLADALGWPQFALLGHSMGGALAQLLVLDHPERVSSLVLMSTFCGPVAGLAPDLVALGAAIVAQGGVEALSMALAVRRASDPVAVAHREKMEASRPGFGDGADRRLLACSPDMWLAMAPRFLTWPSTLERLAGVAVPTLVVTGADDTTMRPDCERLAAAVRGARLVVFDDTAHSPHLEVPEACWAAVTDFLGEHASVGGSTPAPR